MDFGNMKELLAAGGPVLILLVLLSIYSVGLMLERFFRIRRAISYSHKLIEYCHHPIRSGNYTKVLSACKKESVKNIPAASLLATLVEEKNRPTEELEKIADNTITFEVSKLQRSLTVLGTLGSITPFIGLFGTVIGVMHAFKDLSSPAVANAAAGAASGATVVAAGIAEALVNTAAGLFVAIPAVIAYNYFLSKTNYFAQELDKTASDFIYTSQQREEEQL